MIKPPKLLPMQLFVFMTRPSTLGPRLVGLPAPPRRAALTFRLRSVGFILAAADCGTDLL